MKSVYSTSKAKATMLRAESTTTPTAGIDTSNSSTRFTVLLVPQTQCCMWTKLVDMVRMPKWP